MDSEKEYNNSYLIPVNYTDSGKLFGGMLEVRNTVEAAVLVLLIGYPQVAWLPLHGSMKIIVLTVTIIPIAVFALMGIGGDSLLQYLSHIIHWWFSRRQLHYRRIGYKYENTTQKRKARRSRAKD